MTRPRARRRGAQPTKTAKRAPEAPAAGDESPRERLLDAAERLLVTVGHDRITTRALGEEAGLNHGLVHYYYGSMEELFLAVLERFTARLIVRQRAMYAAEGPFLSKWRTAMDFLDQDLASGYPKVYFELQAMAWNRPAMRARLEALHGEWRKVLTEALTKALERYGMDASPARVAAWVALITTFNSGIFIERLGGVKHGHAELLEMIDEWLRSLEKRVR